MHLTVAFNNCLNMRVMHPHGCSFQLANLQPGNPNASRLNRSRCCGLHAARHLKHLHTHIQAMITLGRLVSIIKRTLPVLLF